MKCRYQSNQLNQVISIFQGDHNELTKTVKRVHGLKNLSDDDENTNEDKSKIGYIGDISKEVKKVGKGTKTLPKHGRKTARKRQTNHPRVQLQKLVLINTAKPMKN